MMLVREKRREETVYDKNERTRTRERGRERKRENKQRGERRERREKEGRIIIGISTINVCRLEGCLKSRTPPEEKLKKRDREEGKVKREEERKLLREYIYI